MVSVSQIKTNLTNLITADSFVVLIAVLCCICSLITPLPVNMKILPHNGRLNHHLSRRGHAPFPRLVPQRLDLLVGHVGF